MKIVWASDGVNVTVNGQTVSFLRGASVPDLLDALQTYPPEHRELVALELVALAKAVYPDPADPSRDAEAIRLFADRLQEAFA